MPPRALACPECGADHNSGWREEALYDGVDLPEKFDYDEFARQEFGSARTPTHIGTAWSITALVLVLLTLLYLFATR